MARHGAGVQSDQRGAGGGEKIEEEELDSGLVRLSRPRMTIYGEQNEIHQTDIIYFASFTFVFAASALRGAVGGMESGLEKTLEAAKKEGQLTLYGSPNTKGFLANSTKSIRKSKSPGFLIAARTRRGG
jgi:hypothetical protein